jgi:hypothetical protein
MQHKSIHAKKYTEQKTHRTKKNTATMRNPISVAQLENNCIAKNTKHRYNSTNYQFVLWLYNNRSTYEGFLRPALIASIDSILASTIPEKKKKNEVRKVIIGWLSRMVRGDSAASPVDMNKVDYEVVALYMSQKTRGRGEGEEEGGNDFMSKGSYGGIRSGVIFLFTMSQISPPPSFRDRIATLLKGFKRTILEQKVRRGETLDEGKEAMSFQCYKLLCKKFFEGEKDEYLFALLFLVLEWNLIARSDNIVNLAIGDLEWSDDSLIIYLKKSKTDQEGVDSLTPFHVYFNPTEPSICPGVALGMYLFSNPGIIMNNKKLFPADHQYNRYSSILMKVIVENRSEFERLGVKVGSIGSHSARKGAATLAASGCTVSPSMASICNRAGWKMGGTRDKYIKYEAAGDQFLGRTLCGLNSLVKEFSVSPPFFDMNASEVATIDGYMKSNTAGGMQMGPKIFEVTRMCFASLVYHQQYLKDKLHEKHRYRSHPFMMHLPEVSTVVCFFLIFFSKSNFYFFFSTRHCPLVSAGRCSMMRRMHATIVLALLGSLRMLLS